MDEDHDLPTTEEVYDEIVLCVLADTAKKLLGKGARWSEKFILGSTVWSDDITVTHNVGFLFTCIIEMWGRLTELIGS